MRPGHKVTPVPGTAYTQFPLIRDTCWRLVKILGEIRDRLVLGNKFTVAIEIFTMKLPYIEAKFRDRTIHNSGIILGQTSLKTTLSFRSKKLSACLFKPRRLQCSSDIMAITL